MAKKKDWANLNLLGEIVSELKIQAQELHDDGSRNDFDQGMLVGLVEALTLIHDVCIGYDLRDIDLDFDVDKAYLCE